MRSSGGKRRSGDWTAFCAVLEAVSMHSKFEGLAYRSIAPLPWPGVWETFCRFPGLIAAGFAAVARFGNMMLQ